MEDLIEWKRLDYFNNIKILSTYRQFYIDLNGGSSPATPSRWDNCQSRVEQKLQEPCFQVGVGCPEEV